MDGLKTVLVQEILRAKKIGFSDFQIARLIFKSKSSDIENDLLKVREFRKANNIVPYVKQIDTLAGEFPAQINYLYLTYNGTEHDIEFQHDNKSVIVLGSRPHW